MKKIAFFIIVIISLVSCNNNLDTFEIKLNEDWILFQKSDSQDIRKLSDPDFVPHNYYKTNVPSTVFNVLVNNGVYKDIFEDDNLDKIDKTPFQKPWFFRKTFNFDKTGKIVFLNIDGINYYADIWLNGVKIADKDTLKNPFRRYKIEISDLVKIGKNSLLFKIYPPKKGDFNIGFVDWNPQAPDNEMGIFRPVYLTVNNGISIEKCYVYPEFQADDFSTAGLIIQTELRNNTNKKISSKINLKLNDSLIFYEKVDLDAGENKKIVFHYKNYPSLLLKNVKLWYPHNIGTPYLYEAEVFVGDMLKLYDRKKFKLGIRDVRDYVTEQGHRGVTINGRKILIKGGGWVDNLLLNNTDDNLKAQLEYVKLMNLNTIRLEGFWGESQRLFDLADSMGIMIMAGWSCQWEWKNILGKEVHPKFGGVVDSSDIELISRAWKDQILWLRQHPAVIMWLSGSDKIPHPEAEKKYIAILREFDSTRIYVPSAKEWTSEISGKSRMKMRGPYQYVPPVYWFEDTILGGAFGFNTETGPGPQVPPVESLKKMLSEKHLWPIDSVWLFHCGRGKFGNLDKYNEALFARYGTPENVEEYAFTAQILNYELMRAMFEAFSANRYKATGVIQWMLNSAWPEMYWQLYDYYLMPNGAFFGAKKANGSIHAVFDYARNSIVVVNETLKDINNIKLYVVVFDKNSNKVLEKNKILDLTQNSALTAADLNDFKIRDSIYFLVLTLSDTKNNIVDDNFYWLSYKKDILDYGKSNWYITPVSTHADFRALKTLPQSNLYYSMTSKKNKTTTKFTINISNDDKIAFFVYLSLRNKDNGQTVLPVYWSDNYISFAPNSAKTITAIVENKYLNNGEVFLDIKSYNSKIHKK